MGRLSKLKEREKTTIYCNIASKDTKITKWYKNYGNRMENGNSDVYDLVCEEPWKEATERTGRSGSKKINVACGNDRRCPYLLALWKDEINEEKGGKKSKFAEERELLMPKPELDPTRFFMEYLASNHRGKRALISASMIERVTRFSQPKCIGNSLIKLGLAKERTNKNDCSYDIDLEGIRKYLEKQESVKM
jgi:hypothetical protein